MFQNEYEKLTYSFSSMSPEIMNQIQMSHPEIYDLFQCHLSRRNPIDKHLMNIIIHGAVKGQCPSVMSETIKSWHHLVGRVGGQSFLYCGLHSDYVSERC